MEYFNIQKKLLKKTFVFNKYLVKSGLLDILGFFFFIIMLFIVVASFQYFAMSVQTYEQDYSSISQDNSLQDSFKLEIAQNYLNSINVLIAVVAISIIGLFLLSYLFGTFIKLIQYKFLDKTLYKGFKDYLDNVLLTIRNTFPLFLVFIGLSYALIVLFGLTLAIIIIVILLFLIYWATLPLLRLCSFRNKNFKKTWKNFFKLIKKSIYFMPFVKLFIIAGIIILFLLTLINGLTSSLFLNYFISLITIIFIVLLYAFSRRYIYISTKVLLNSFKHKNK